MKTTKITRQLLIDALVWNCPHYTRDGAFSCCVDYNGRRSNCAKELCTHVSDIFRTMGAIQNKEIEVL